MREHHLASEYGDLDSDGVPIGYKCDEIEDPQCDEIENPKSD